MISSKKGSWCQQQCLRLPRWVEGDGFTGIFYPKIIKWFWNLHPTPKRWRSLLTFSQCFPELSDGLTRGPAYVSLADRLQTWQSWAQGPAVPTLFFMKGCQFLQWARTRNKCLELIWESLNQILPLIWVNWFLLNQVSRCFRESFLQYKRHHLHDSRPTLLQKLISRDWTMELTPMSEESPSNWENYGY